MNSRSGEQSNELGADRLLTPEEAALMLQISVRSVHRLVRLKKLQCIEYGPKTRRFTEEMLKNPIVHKKLSPQDSTRVDMDSCGPLPSIPGKGGDTKKSLGTDFKALHEEWNSWQ